MPISSFFGKSRGRGEGTSGAQTPSAQRDSYRSYADTLVGLDRSEEAKIELHRIKGSRYRVPAKGQAGLPIAPDVVTPAPNKFSLLAWFKTRDIPHRMHPKVSEGPSEYEFGEATKKLDGTWEAEFWHNSVSIPSL